MLGGQVSALLSSTVRGTSPSQAPPPPSRPPCSKYVFVASPRCWRFEKIETFFFVCPVGLPHHLCNTRNPAQTHTPPPTILSPAVQMTGPDQQGQRGALIELSSPCVSLDLEMDSSAPFRHQVGGHHPILWSKGQHFPAPPPTPPLTEALGSFCTSSARSPGGPVKWVPRCQHPFRAQRLNHAA